MRKKLAAAVMAVGVLALPGGLALAETSTVTATIGSTDGTVSGTRSITAVTPAVALAQVAGTTSFSGTVAVTVVEALRTGQNWSVNAVMSSDLVHATDNTKTINKSAVSVAPGDVTVVNGSGAASATKGGGGTLDSSRTLWSVAQNSAAVYTGTYTSTSSVSLAVPNGTTAGVYSGTLTVTLVQ